MIFDDFSGDKRGPFEIDFFCLLLPLRFTACGGVRLRSGR